MKFFTRITLLTIAFCCYAFTGSAVTAGFTADVTSGCAPLVVHFTNSSSGATSYAWDLGNGTTSPLTNVSGSYTTPGTYTVKLVATGPGGSSTYTMTITVYPAPTVSFYAVPTSACPGAPITFTSTSSGGVPGALLLTWNFGDGSLGSGSPATHAYTGAGSYNVTLYVTNATGCSNSLALPGYITIYKPPVPNFGVAPSHFCSSPGKAVFSNYSTGTPALTYNWSFGDGVRSTATSPTHTYTTPGSYTIGLSVKDGNGCMDSVVTPAYITVSNLVASFTLPSSSCLNTPDTFWNTSTTHISSLWDFGDGSTSITDTGVHSYTAPGTYTVQLIVFDGFCFDTIKHTIVIHAAPAASFTQSPKDPCPPPVGVSFTGTVPGGTLVNWDFGDGNKGTGTPISHIYARRGVDTIRMYATDPATGCADTVQKIDTLYDNIFKIIDTPAMGCRPLTVHFDYLYLTSEPDTTRPPSLYPFPITSYSWNFGDGSPSSSVPRPIHTYTAVGIYKAFVTVTSSNGCTFSDTVTIAVGDPPIVTGFATPLHACIHTPVVIPITVVKGPADDFFWEFGAIGGVESRGDTLYMSFPIPGTFVCTVSASYRGCLSAPYVITTPIVIDSPKAKFAWVPACKPRTSVNFYDNSIGADSILWLFGDGTTSRLKNPVHNYPSLATYTVTLTAFNAKSGCRDTAIQVINLTPTVFDFTADHVNMCRDEIVYITPVITTGSASFYEWYVNGVLIPDTSHVNIHTHVLRDTFHVTGKYTIMLVITDQLGCRDTLTKVNYLTVAKPVAAITVTPPSGCRPLSVAFKDVSTDVPGVTFTNFSWTFGDGGTASLSSPSTTHVYTNNGSYAVREIVTDIFGCKDTAKFSPIIVNRPVASFSVSNPFPCAWDSIYFTNSSTGIVSSLWLFGDGTTSAVYSDWHAYKTKGTFIPKLVVKDVYGCTDTAISPTVVDVTRPTAAFNMSDSFSICPPLKVTFYNKSSYDAVYFSWIFGDGNTSTGMYPSNLYVGVGYYSVRLIATDNNGCSDTAIHHVNIFGYAGALDYTPLTGCVPLKVHFKSHVSNVPSIIWDFADGVTSAASTTDSIDHIYTFKGAFVPKLILSDNTGCQNSSLGVDTIKVDAVTTGFTTVPYPVCEHGTMYFKDTSNSYFAIVNSWLWTFTDGTTSTLAAPANTYSAAGTYEIKLRVTDSWGCTDSGKQSILVYPPPVITVCPDTLICVGDGATLTGYGGVSYTWAPQATVSCTKCNPTVASPQVVTTYTVTGADKNGCENTDTVVVRLKTKTISSGHGDTTICFGKVVPLYDSGATKFTWIPAKGLNDPFIANPLASPDTSTTYMVIAQLASCIADTNYVTVTVHPAPTVNAGPDQTILAGQEAEIRASGSNISGLSWGNDSTLSCNSCPNPSAKPFVTTTYVVSVTSLFGCPASDSITINVYCDKSQVFVPNTFTPNGDGENDVFYPRGTGIAIVKSFRIYNRWGQLLFERSNIQLNDASNAWDGSFQGDKPKPDVFVYVIDAICDAGDPINIKGDVTIIR